MGVGTIEPPLKPDKSREIAGVFGGGARWVGGICLIVCVWEQCVILSYRYQVCLEERQAFCCAVWSKGPGKA